MIRTEPLHQLEGVANGFCLHSLPDGRLVFQGKESSLCLWNPIERSVEVIPHPLSGIEAMAALDSNRLAVLCLHDSLTIFDTTTLKLIGKKPTSWNGTPFWSPDKISVGDGWHALGFYKGHIAVYDSESSSLLAELPEADSEVWTLQALKDRRLLFGRLKGDLGVWNWETGEVQVLRETGCHGESWVLRGGEGQILLPPGFEQFDLGGGEVIVSSQVPVGEDVFLAADPHWLVTGRESGAVEFDNMKTGRLSSVGNGGWLIRCLCTMPEGRIASLSERGVVSVWELPSAE